MPRRSVRSSACSARRSPSATGTSVWTTYCSACLARAATWPSKCFATSAPTRRSCAAVSSPTSARRHSLPVGLRSPRGSWRVRYDPPGEMLPVRASELRHPADAPHSSRSVRITRAQPGETSPGESAGEVAPPAALRTGRDSLLSSGPHSPAGGECDEVPVGEQGGPVAVDRLQPLGRSGVFAAESFEFVHGPPG
jgi:hypothetical protein